MPLPPPMRDPLNIETRLEVVAVMLEQAIAEVRRAMDELQSEVRHEHREHREDKPR